MYPNAQEGSVFWNSTRCALRHPQLDNKASREPKIHPNTLAESSSQPCKYCFQVTCRDPRPGHEWFLQMYLLHTDKIFLVGWDSGLREECN